MFSTVATVEKKSDVGRKMFSSAFSFLFNGRVSPSLPPTSETTVSPANSISPPTEVSLR